MDHTTTFNCPHCGALYAVTPLAQRLAVESASARCRACNVVMLQWTTASPPAFELIERPAESRKRTPSEAA